LWSTIDRSASGTAILPLGTWNSLKALMRFISRTLRTRTNRC
jgi:hypothetical protein